ncbi:MAG: hypothetical protein OFPI_30270 [Osedax symbiont Rs2]|nr:MAG: hypothetical protein OFPI_30270 [Osedax symbiont Rs2]
MSNISKLENTQSEQLQIEVGGHSEAGAKTANQDAFAVKINSGSQLQLKGHIAVLADGVSSANCAARASQMSVCHFIEEYMTTPQSWSVKKSTSRVISSLNNWLYSRQRLHTVDNQPEQWFSTFSALVLKANRCYMFHIGDCQIAKYNQDGYQVLSSEHATSTGVLNRALGAAKHIEVDYSYTDLKPSDIFILCSDGVYNFVSSKLIINIIDCCDNLELASQKITQLAIDNGSGDNVTCLLLRINKVPKADFNQQLFDRQQQVIPPSLQPGALLDHYQILDILQHSPRSHVYLAKDQQQQRLVVIKIPSVNFIDDQPYLQAFIKEGWIGARIDHPSLMKIYPQLAQSQFLYHSCEYVEGQTLTQWMHDNPQPTLSSVRNIAQQIISALRVLRRLDVVHCDVKPDNFIIDYQGRIKLIDFGSCSIGVFDQHNSPELPLGTLCYSAPEVLLGAKNTHQSDLFSVAVIVYQMLCGKMPYRQIADTGSIPTRFSLWRYRELRSLRPDLPNAIDRVLSEALAADPENRCSHYSELVSGLQNLSQFNSIKITHRPLLERDPIKFWRSLSAILAVLLLLALLLP